MFGLGIDKKTEWESRGYARKERERRGYKRDEVKMIGVAESPVLSCTRDRRLFISLCVVVCVSVFVCVVS
jgi:hypothetical protein